MKGAVLSASAGQLCLLSNSGNEKMVSEGVVKDRGCLYNVSGVGGCAHVHVSRTDTRNTRPSPMVFYIFFYFIFPFVSAVLPYANYCHSGLLEV